MSLGSASGPDPIQQGLKVAIMQPYFLPYLGYFQLIDSVDLFVVYDNIKYTKKGWINRNRILCNGADATISLPLQADSDSLDIRDRRLAPDFRPKKLLSQVSGAYRKAPYFDETFPLVERIVGFSEGNLFRFLRHSISETCRHLGVATQIRNSSEIAADHTLKGQDRVLALCEAVGASVYVNAIGGQALYATDAFACRGISLRFIKSRPTEYPQFGEAFVPWLSIIDVMMFNPLSTVQRLIAENYDLI